MSGWHHCGEGFSGVEKFNKVIADISDKTSSRTEDVDCSIESIANEKTPDGKSRVKKLSRKQTDVRESHLNSSRHLSCGPVRAIWKQDEFLDGFQVSKDPASQKSEDISWSTGSSDESIPNEMFEVKKQKSIIKKRKHRGDGFQGSGNTGHVSKGPANNLSSKPGCQTESVLSPRVYDTPECPEKSQQKIHDTEKSSCEDSVKITNVLEKDSESRIKEVKNMWKCSPFEKVDEISQAASPSSLLLEDNIRIKRRRMFRKFTSSKCKAARRLDTCPSQELAGQISDIESDTDSVASVTNNKNINGVDEEMIVSDADGSCDDENVNEEHGRIRDKRNESHLLELQNSQDSISDATPSSPSQTKEETIRASEWVSALHKQKTPVKGTQSMDTQGEDSAKKKRKFSRGSYADQLSRLLSREKSAVRFWYHGVKERSLDEKSSKSINLRLLTLVRHYSTYVSQCRRFGVSGETVDCKALFLHETVERLSLKAGMTVQIFAPWQQLDESSGSCTYFCTHYVRVVSTPDQERESDHGDAGHRISVSASWRCPCIKDPHLAVSSCPATRCPVLPHNIALQGLEPSSQAPGSAMLHCVTLTQSQTQKSFSIKRSLLESMEMMRSDAVSLPPFSASVLRVLRHRVKNSLKIRYQVLLEDDAGTAALVNLPDDAAGVENLVGRLEGKLCLCSGLGVVSRTTRDRDPALFTVFDRVWTPWLSDNNTQLSQSSSAQYVQSHSKVPNFAYVLQSVCDVQCLFDEDKSEDGRTNNLELLSLQQTLQKNCGERVSFIARVLVLPRLQEMHQPQQIFVYDTACDGKGYTSVHKVDVSSECVVEESSSLLYLFRDILLDKGKLICDGNTMVIGRESWEVWGLNERLESSVTSGLSLCKLTLPEVSRSSFPGTVVRVEGTISGVDESSAYSWQECDVCGSDRLVSSEELGETYCMRCNKKVASPVVRMKMEAFVRCGGRSPGLVVKIDLTQRNIEALLPSESDDEGYDLESVMDKPVTCPACVVARGVTNHQNREASEEMTSLGDKTDGHVPSMVLTELIFSEAL